MQVEVGKKYKMAVNNNYAEIHSTDESGNFLGDVVVERSGKEYARMPGFKWNGEGVSDRDSSLNLTEELV